MERDRLELIYEIQREFTESFFTYNAASGLSDLSDKEINQLKNELITSQEQVQQVEELNIKLEGILSQLREDNHNLTLEMDDIKSKGILTSEYRLPIVFVTFILLILVGFIAGYSFYQSKVVKRFGGLEF